MKRWTVLIVLILMTGFAYAQAGETNEIPEPIVLPPVVKELRRAEIVTFGSLPFVTLYTTLGFSVWRYIEHDFASDYTPNPFLKGSSALAFSQEEQLTILFTSLGISVGIGITDFIISMIKHSAEKKRAEETRQRAITVTPVAAASPITTDPTAVKLPPPHIVKLQLQR